MSDKSNVTTAVEILRNDGPRALLDKSQWKAIQTFPRLKRYKSKREVLQRIQEEEWLGEIIDTVVDVQPGISPYHVHAVQLKSELRALAEHVDRHEPKTVMEIGTKNGGTLYVWSRYIDSVDHIISLDLPGADFGGGYEKAKIPIYRTFASKKQMDFVRENSHEEETYEQISDLLTNSVDFLLIDGDHTYEGVKQDFEMYSRLVADGGLIAFHDIVQRPNNPNSNVKEFWDELREEYDVTEYIEDRTQGWGGIGLIEN